MEMDKLPESPRASIVIIAYNRENCIDRAIESACGQTEKNIEIVCVDDGSTDATLERMKQWAARDERIKLITQPNGGTLSARCAGIRQAAGKYTLFLDSDDILVPDTVKTACGAADECGADVLEFGLGLTADATNPPDKERIQYLESVFSQTAPLPEPPRGAALVNACFAKQTFVWSLCNKAFRTELLQKAVRFYQGEWLCMAEDMLITLMVLCSAEHFARIPEKLYVYTVGGGMSTKAAAAPDRTAIKIWGTEWLSLKLARQWLEKLNYPVEEIAEGLDAYAERFRQNAISYLIALGTAESRAEYLRWLTQYCTGEELIDVVCASLAQCAERYENSAYWKITKPLRFAVNKLREIRGTP